MLGVSKPATGLTNQPFIPQYETSRSSEARVPHAGHPQSRSDEVCFGAGRREVQSRQKPLPLVPPLKDAHYYAFFRQNREKFLQQLPPDTTVIVMSNTESTQSNDNEYRFRQGSDFFWLTGYEEPQSIAVLSNQPGQPGLMMLVRPKNPLMEQWVGRRSGKEAAQEQVGADVAWEIKTDAYGGFQAAMQKWTGRMMTRNPEEVSRLERDLEPVLKEAVKDSRHIWLYPSETDPLWNARVRQAIGQARPENPADETSTKLALHTARLVKSPQEIDWIRAACQVSMKAHIEAMRAVGNLARHRRLTTAQLPASFFSNGQRPLVTENEIRATLEHRFTRNASTHTAYPSIVASGPNAAILHYNTNEDVARRGQLILSDAGASHNNYAADVTTTYPASGKFTPFQKALYEVVLRANRASIKAVRPGGTLMDVQQASERELMKGLKALSILPETAERWDLMEFFPHGVSHWMGLDVHDFCTRKMQFEEFQLPLKPGMVFSVEPGIYISPEMAERLKKRPVGIYKGHQQVQPLEVTPIGIRIEDNIRVTPTGYENLTRGVPRSVKAIERLMASD